MKSDLGTGSESSRRLLQPTDLKSYFMQIQDGYPVAMLVVKACELQLIVTGASSVFESIR